MAQSGPTMTMLCIEYGLPLMLAPFPPLSATVLRLTVPKLSTEPVINMADGVEATGSDFPVVTPHSDGSNFSLPDGRNV